MTWETNNNARSFAQLCQLHELDVTSINVVAFDIFDTLLYRTVSPSYVWHLWAEEVCRTYHLSKTADDVVKSAHFAGRLAKLQNICRGADREYHYHQMTDLLRLFLGVSCSSDDFYETCLELMLKVERSVTYVPDEMRVLVSDVKAHGKKVICISDFYLPAEAIKKLLRQHQLPIDVLFVSETYLRQKASGRLYQVVLDKLHFPANEILMIGDNQVSDYTQARNYGLQAIWLDHTEQHMYYKERNAAQEEARAQFRQLMAINRTTSQPPFSSVAYLMFIFIDRLYRRLRADHCEDALFMSREGEFFKKLFDNYQNICVKPSDRIRSHYFYVSRQATLLPSIHVVEKDSFREIYKNYPSLSILDFLKNLKLDQNKKLIESLQSKMDIHKTISYFPDSEEYQELLASPVFQEECLRAASDQRDLFSRYLEQLGIDYRTKGIYIVDIGYSGTSQNNIHAIFRGDVSIKGYYMISTSRPELLSPHNQKYGIIYDQATRKQHPKDAFSYNAVILEEVSLASHGSVEAYALQGETVVPVLHQDEQELNCYRNTVSVWQQTILTYFSQIAKLIHDAGLDENSYYKMFRKRYTQFVFNPTEDEMRQYKNLVITDNFAGFKQCGENELHTTRPHKKFCWKSFLLLCRTKGWSLNEQNTNWMAVAFYSLDLWGFNSILQYFAQPTMKVYDLATELAVKRRHRKKK